MLNARHRSDTLMKKEKKKRKSPISYCLLAFLKDYQLWRNDHNLTCKHTVLTKWNCQVGGYLRINMGNSLQFLKIPGYFCSPKTFLLIIISKRLNKRFISDTRASWLIESIVSAAGITSFWYSVIESSIKSDNICEMSARCQIHNRYSVNINHPHPVLKR